MSERTEILIREHAAALKEELNVRLLCEETKGAIWENVLWVDEVLVTEISDCRGRRKRKTGKSSFWSRIKRVFFRIARFFALKNRVNDK